MVKKICDCCGNPMDREAMFDAIIVHMGKDAEIRWDACSTCSHHIAQFFEREFAYTQGRSGGHLRLLKNYVIKPQETE